MPRIGRLSLVALVLTLPLLVGGPSATASCTEDSGPAGSDIVFVGSAEENRRGYTRFEVSEVLAGPALAPEVWVRSGQEQPPWPFSLLSGVSSSGDADFVVGYQYVVGATDEFGTGACSVEELRGDRQLQPLRTSTAGPPQSDGLGGADPPIGALGISLVLTTGIALLLALRLALRRRRQSAD